MAAMTVYINPAIPDFPINYPSFVSDSVSRLSIANSRQRAIISFLFRPVTSAISSYFLIMLLGNLADTTDVSPL